MREACDLEQSDIPAHMGSQPGRAGLFSGASDSQQHERKQEDTVRRHLISVLLEKTRIRDGVVYEGTALLPSVCHTVEAHVVLAAVAAVQHSR